MRLLPIQNTTTLRELTDTVGVTNLPTVLHVNQLKRTPRVGEYYQQLIQDTKQNGVDPTLHRKKAILDQLSTDDDIFERAALLDQEGWRVLSNLNTLEGYVQVPESVTMPTTAYMLGTGVSVSKKVYSQAITELLGTQYISPAVFNEYDGNRNYNIRSDTSTGIQTNPFSAFKFPWGEVTLVDDLTNESVDFPVYPEDVSDAHKANYTQMPDLLYQYEQWLIPQSSGPRSNTYEFHFHRDMWSGDHRDGQANNLIRFCDAHTYFTYQGSTVHVNPVSLYVHGDELIHGLILDDSVKWSGPLGLDGWYLECTLDLTIQEVSKEALSYAVMRNKGLIG